MHSLIQASRIFLCIALVLASSVFIGCGKPGPLAITQISVGGPACVLFNSGDTKCFGADSTFSNTVPDVKLRALSVGRGFSCGITIDNKVICWKEQAIVSTQKPSEVATQISMYNAGSRGTQICALLQSGKPYCWLIPVNATGYSEYDVNNPPGPYLQISTGDLSGYLCGLKEDGTVECLDSRGSKLAPYLVSPERFNKWQSISGGLAGLACALNQNSNAICFGGSQIGLTEFDFANQERLTQFSMDYHWLCGILQADQSLKCWGFNNTATLAIGPPPKKFKSIQVGYLNACGLDVGGYLSCWSYPPNGYSPGVSGI